MAPQKQQEEIDSMSGLEIELVYANRYQEAMVDELAQRGIYAEITTVFRKYQVDVIEEEHEEEEKKRGEGGEEEVEKTRTEDKLKDLHQRLHSKNLNHLNTKRRKARRKRL